MHKNEILCMQRPESNYLSAQIDYVVVTRKLIFFIECKNLFGNIDIDNQGNFVRNYSWNGKTVKEGIYSPITQNQRHLEVLKQINRASRKNVVTKMISDKVFDGFNKSIVVLANPKTVLNAKYANTYRDRFVFVDGDYEIDEGVWLISHKTMGLAARGKKAHMVRKTEKGFVADDFQHEQSLVFEAENGLVILNSCCHGGVDNIIEEVMIGTKSMSGKPEDVSALSQRLFDLNVKHIYTGHCTGNPAYKILKEKLGQRLQYFSTGTIVEL